jgi:hypothetical protein
MGTGNLTCSEQLGGLPAVEVLINTIRPPGMTTTVMASSLNPSNVGQAVTFTAAVTNRGAIEPSGTVTFWEGSTALGTGTLNGMRAAAFTRRA